MADQFAITLYAGDATPVDIVLRDLPVADVAADTTCYLYPSPVPAAPGGTDPAAMTLRAGDATPSDIVLTDIPNWTATAPEVVIILRDQRYADTGGVTTYYGVLRRWTGTSWTKAKMMVYAGGSWVAKPLKRWTGSGWVLVDTTGV
jgi:hypothetical protein